jgi:hypothetical protein
LTALDRLLDEHTDRKTTALRNDAGHRSGGGGPFTSGIMLHLRREHGMPCRGSHTATYQ